MTVVRETLPPDQFEGQVAHYAIIGATATDMADLLPVIIPEFDPHLLWGPCRWQSRDAISLPAKGNPCLVMFDNRRDPWIVVWWPF